ncbi:hypothetical protein MRX96_028519 [Rhipicephalus microplus]
MSAYLGHWHRICSTVSRREVALNGCIPYHGRARERAARALSYGLRSGGKNKGEESRRTVPPVSARGLREPTLAWHLRCLRACICRLLSTHVRAVFAEFVLL